jgi:CRISPR-associated endonuclease/helicase Cas3
MSRHGALSPAAHTVWAKSLDKNGAWLPLWRHLDDSADVARHLFDRWLAPNVVRLLAEPFDGDRDAARVAATFLAGIHDIGKATPAFAIQDGDLAQKMREAGLWMPDTKWDLPERQLAHHAVAGHHILKDWLTAQGWPVGAARAWGVIVGGHHGLPPDQTAEDEAQPAKRPCLYLDDAWHTVRLELIERVATRTGMSGRIPEWAGVALSQQFQVIATALVILADWIASNEDLFPFYKEPPEAREDPGRVSKALARLRLPAPWRARPPQGPATEVFRQRFSLPADATPRPVQEAALDLARSMPEPGIMIIEAPMGEGKTEAALAAAEVLAERFRAGGLFVALPTQATSDAIFARILDWLDRIAAGGGDPGGSIALSHGKAKFNRLFQGLVVAGTMRDIGREDETDDRHAERRRRAHKAHKAGKAGRSFTEHALTAHAWLMGHKKTHLANVVVGTIDQVLFAGLKARHLMLRHLAVAGKVVVIDEIHAYDAYMSSYLTKVLTWLGGYGVPVIALSATLPAARCAELVAAYQVGRRSTGRRRGGNPDQVTVPTGYPLLTWTEGDQVRGEPVAASARRTTVHMEALNDDLSTLVATLRETLADGGCVLVVRNTVRRVLEAAEAIEKEFPGEVTVAHARFIVADRLRNDDDLLRRFGPPDGTRERPARHIVVASQVAEQSLDVDFDVLVTDLAPVDLVLQRMGRLHRHQRGDGQSDRPEKVRVPLAFITGTDFSETPPVLERAAERYVYSKHVLLRSAAALLPRFGKTISLPDDIPSLVAEAYGEQRIGPPEWQEAMDEAAGTWDDRTAERRSRARVFQVDAPGRVGKAIVGWLGGNIGEADDDNAKGRAQVRDAAPRLEAILVQADPDGRWHTPAWLDESRGSLPVPQQETPSEQVSEVLGACTISLPLDFSNQKCEDELWQATPPAWEFAHLIYRLPALVVDEHGWGELGGQSIRYTTQRGLEVFRRDE